MITKNILFSAAIASLSFGAVLASEGNMNHQYPFAFPTAQDAFNNDITVSNYTTVVKKNGNYQYEIMGTVEEVHRDDRLKEIAHDPAVACSALLLLINGDCAEYDKFKELVAQHGTTDLSHLCPEFNKQKEEDATKPLLGENGAGQEDLALLAKMQEAADQAKNDIPAELTGATSTENGSADKTDSTEHTAE